MKTISIMKIFVLFYIQIEIILCKNASEWRSRSIYQMLTDRFSRTNISSNRCLEQPISENALRNYCGGTYRGAIDQLDYLVELGFNAIWISPIPANVDKQTKYGVGWHGYWQENLYRLNEHFGSENDLIDFISEAHKREIWIMLDVVANHFGPNITGNYFPFNRSEHFHQPFCLIKDYNNQTEVEFCSVGSEDNPLPDLNTENEFVISTLYSWINQTIRKYQFDGIRIDTFRHIRPLFWKDYIKSSGVYSLGEVSSMNSSYVGSYQSFADGILHYPLYYVLKSIFTDNDQQRQSMFSLENQIRTNEKYFQDTTLCGIFLDNHDQDRFLNHTQNPRRIQNALVYLMFSDGIPIVYMGTEQNFVGNPNVMNGAGDPWNREALWRSNYDRSNWIYNYISILNRIRSSFNDEFFTSHQQTIFIDHQTYMYKKGLALIVVSNQPFDCSKRIKLPSIFNSSRYRDLISNRIHRVNKCQSVVIRNWIPMILIPVLS